MKYSRQLIIVPLLTIVFSAHAGYEHDQDDQDDQNSSTGERLLSEGTNKQTIYSGAAVTAGAGSIVGGNVDAFAAVTLGADTTIGIDIVGGAAATLGAGSNVGGTVTTFQAATLGANAMIGGGLTSGADIYMGANTAVRGAVTSGTAVSLGDSASVFGDITAALGPVVLGANSRVYRDVTAGTAITVSASATHGGDLYDSTRTPFDAASVIDRRDELKLVQAALNSMPTTEMLATTMSVNTRLGPGVYHAPGLTTTAGISLTLVGDPETPQLWVFNIDTYLSLGAGTKIILENVHQDSTLIWNTGGYTFIGALSTFRGTILAGSYVTTGAGSTLNGVADSCGGILTIGGAVTLGATNVVGAMGCSVGAMDNCTVENGMASCDVLPPDNEEYCPVEECG
jgi:MSHA biogenesis protein MshQ